MFSEAFVAHTFNSMILLDIDINNITSATKYKKLLLFSNKEEHSLTINLEVLK